MAKQEVFVPRTGLQRSIQYRPQVKLTYYLLLACAAILLFDAGLNTLLKLIYETPADALVNLLVYSIIPGVLFAEAFLIVRPMAFSTIRVFGDRLEIDQMDQTLHLPYADVKEISFSYLPYTGGWFCLKTEQKKHRFTVILERSEYILESIAAFNPQLVPLKKLEDYRRTAICADHSGTRTMDKARNWKAMLLKYIAAPAVASTLLSLLFMIKTGEFNPTTWSFFALGLGCIQMVLAYGVWTITWFILTAHTRAALIKNPNNVIRDMKFEAKVDLISEIAQRVIMGSILLILIIMTLTSTRG